MNTDTAIIVKENEFNRVYRVGEVDMYVAKAYDEKTNKHFIVCSIPKIAELNVLHIKFPFEFELEPMRDAFFDNFDAVAFLHALKEKIILNREKIENEQDKNDSVPI